MRTGAAWVLGLFVALCGAALATAPFLRAEGPSGPAWPFPGSIFDLKPVYGLMLMVAGLVVTGFAIASVVRERAAWALRACGVAFVAGMSLPIVHVSSSSAIAFRSASILQLRGPGAWTAAIASLAGFGASILLVTLTVNDEELRHAYPVAD